MNIKGLKYIKIQVFNREYQDNVDSRVPHSVSAGINTMENLSVSFILHRRSKTRAAERDWTQRCCTDHSVARHVPLLKA